MSTLIEKITIPANADQVTKLAFEYNVVNFLSKIDNKCNPKCMKLSTP